MLHVLWRQRKRFHCCTIDTDTHPRQLDLSADILRLRSLLDRQLDHKISRFGIKIFLKTLNLNLIDTCTFAIILKKKQLAYKASFFARVLARKLEREQKNWKAGVGRKVKFSPPLSTQAKKQTNSKLLTTSLKNKNSYCIPPLSSLSGSSCRSILALFKTK